MIDQERVQAAVEMVASLTDDEQEAVYEQLRRRHEARQQHYSTYTPLLASPTSRIEIIAALTKREERAQREGYYTYDHEIRTISVIAIPRTFDSDQSP